MRSCLHSVSLPDLPVLAVLRRAAAAGYRGVELNAETLPWAGPHVTPATSADERAAIVAEAGRLDLALPALGAHSGMVDEDPAARRAALDFVLGCIDLAADLGVPVVHVLSGPLAAPGSSQEQVCRCRRRRNRPCGAGGAHPDRSGGGRPRTAGAAAGGAGPVSCSGGRGPRRRGLSAPAAASRF